jgi:hypothetical protein
MIQAAPFLSINGIIGEEDTDFYGYCGAMTTHYTSHLVVEALSGEKNGKVRKHGSPERIHYLAPVPLDVTT